MACSNVQKKANFTRLSRLLVDRGTEALRNTFDIIHPPATLAAALATSQPRLQRLKPRVIYAKQWNLLYPPSGSPPDSKTFDVTLLTVLLRNICGLPTPATGWDTMPPDTDRSTEANIARIRLFRNEIHAHATSADVDNLTFENLWQNISQALLDLKVSRQQIDDLKSCSLSPEEEEFVFRLQDWELRDRGLMDVFDKLSKDIEDEKGVKRECEEIKCDIKKIRVEVDKIQNKESTIDRKDNEVFERLPKFNFESNIARAVKNFHQGTREWLLRRLDNWFAKEQDSRVMILTAGPGVGKSVFAGKVCEIYSGVGKLAAYHFFKFNDSNLRNPITMLQSLANHMCDNVIGFKEKLFDRLKRPHEVKTPGEAFRVYLHDPLHELKVEEPMLIVIDGFDESATDGKSKMLELIVEEFPFLPKSVKVLVTSRPEIPVKEKLINLNPIEILPGDFNNEKDIQQYFEFCLESVQNKREIVPLLVKKCEGSFLYAFYVQDELLKHVRKKELNVKEVKNFLPAGVGSVYSKYFERLEDDLQAKKNNLDIFKLLEILAAAGGPLPLTFIADALCMKGDTRAMKQIINGVNEAISTLLFVSDDMVSIFHKSVVDWLLSRGYKRHQYTVQGECGHKLLWQLCEKQFKDIKKGILKLQLTNSMKYSLDHGFDHLLSHDVECPAETYAWLVEIGLVHVMITVYPQTPECLISNWRKCLTTERGLSDDLRMKFSWHYFETAWFFIKAFPSYLQLFLNSYPKRLRGKEEENTAKLILSNYVWFQNLNTYVVEEESLFRARLFSSKMDFIAVSSDNALVAVANEGGLILFFNLPELEELWHWDTKSHVQCLSFHPQNCLLLFGKLDVAVDVTSKKEVQFFRGRAERFCSCAFSPSGRRLLTSNGTYVVKLWDVNNQELITSLDDGRNGNELHCCSFTNSGLFISRHCCEDESLLAVWNSITFQRVDKRSVTSKKWREDIGISKSSDSPLNEAVVCKNCLSEQRKDIIFYCNLDAINVLIPPHFVPVSVLHGRCSISLPSLGFYRGCYGIFLFTESGLSFTELFHFATIDVCPSITESKTSLIGIKNLKAISKNSILLHDSDKLISFSLYAQNQKMPPFISCTVVACTFSPDCSRLATCTSDGFINIWSVYNCQAVQRFKANDGMQCPAACWWSTEFLLIFHFVDNVAVLSTYPVNQCLTIMEAKSNHEELSQTVDRSLEILTFSEGIFIFQCKGGPPKSVYVNEIHNQQLLELPGIAIMKKFAVSPGGSTILGTCSGGFTIWRIVNSPTVYEVVAEDGFAKNLPINFFDVSYDYDNDQLDTCCVCCDGKFGVVARTAVIRDPNDPYIVVFMFVDMNSGRLVGYCFDYILFDLHITVFVSSNVVTFNDCRHITAFDITKFKNGLQNDFYVNMIKNKAAYPLKLTGRGTKEPPYCMSGSGDFLAIPLENGNMEFIRIHFPH